MSGYSFGILYWFNTNINDLEFIVARKYSEELPLSLFYHTHQGFANKFWGDLMGQLGPPEKFSKSLTNIEEPNLKITMSNNNIVYYININFVQGLMKNMNGFRGYLDRCGTQKTYSNYDYDYTYNVIETCKSEGLDIGTIFYDFQAITIDEIKNANFNDQSKIALSNFDQVVVTLKKFQMDKKKNLMSPDQITQQIEKQLDFKNINPSIYIKELEKSHNKYILSLDEKHQKTIKNYAINSWYIVNYLRKIYKPNQNEIKLLSNQIISLWDIIKNAPPVTQSFFVYRGMDLDHTPKYSNFTEGHIIDDLFNPSFNSTSFDGNVSAKNFAGSVCCAYIMHLPIGTKGLYIGHYSPVKDQDEFLLPPYLLFEIIKYKNETVPMKFHFPSYPKLLTYRTICINSEKFSLEVEGIVEKLKTEAQKIPELVWDPNNYIEIDKNLKSQLPKDIGQPLVNNSNSNLIVTFHQLNLGQYKPKYKHFLLAYSDNTHLHYLIYDSTIKKVLDKLEVKNENEKNQILIEMAKQDSPGKYLLKIQEKTQLQEKTQKQLQEKTKKQLQEKTQKQLQEKTQKQLQEKTQKQLQEKQLQEKTQKQLHLQEKTQKQLHLQEKPKVPKIQIPLKPVKTEKDEDISIPSISHNHLVGLNSNVLIELKKLADKCPGEKNKDKIMGKKGICVKIDGTIGKQIVKELVLQHK